MKYDVLITDKHASVSKGWMCLPKISLLINLWHLYCIIYFTVSLPFQKSRMSSIIGFLFFSVILVNCAFCFPDKDKGPDTDNKFTGNGRSKYFFAVNNFFVIFFYYRYKCPWHTEISKWKIISTIFHSILHVENIIYPLKNFERK